LIVEDNLLNQKLAKKFLAKLGYEADLANSGVEALEMTRKTDYTVIFMDMQMPHMDGLETTKRIKEEIQSEAKIIAMTANVYEENKQKCFKAGMVGFVTKPFKPKDFAEALLSVEELGPKKDIA
jgi:CheY-like chemotaxis protein